MPPWVPVPSNQSQLTEKRPNEIPEYLLISRERLRGDNFRNGPLSVKAEIKFLLPFCIINLHLARVNSDLVFVRVSGIDTGPNRTFQCTEISRFLQVVTACIEKLPRKVTWNWLLISHCQETVWHHTISSRKFWHAIRTAGADLDAKIKVSSLCMWRRKAIFSRDALRRCYSHFDVSRLWWKATTV